MSSELSNFGTLSAEDHLTALVPVWDAGEETSVLADTGSFLVGSGRQCDVRVVLPGVAAEHCQIECRDGLTFIAPVDRNDVVVNNEPVLEMHQPHVGDLIAIGSAVFRMEQRKASRVRRPIIARHRTAPAQKSVTGSPDEQLDRIESQLAEVVANDQSPGLSLHFSSGLDSRESQLLDLQVRLEQRSIELDSRSAQLTRQQSQLLTRQTELQQLRLEIEAQHSEEFAQLSAQKNLLLDTSPSETDEQRKSLEKLSTELEVRQNILRDKERQLQAASERLAARDYELEELRLELDAAKERHSAEHDAGLDRLRVAQQEQTDQLEALREELNTQRAELTEERTTFGLQLKELNDRAAEVEAKAVELSSLQQEMEDLRHQHEVERAELAGQLRDLESQHAQERADWIEQTQALSESTEQLAAQESQLEQARRLFEEAKVEHLERIADARADLERRETELSWQLESVEEERRVITESKAQLETQTHDIQIAREELLREREEQTAELDAVRTQLETQRSDLDLREQQVAEHAPRIDELVAREAEVEKNQLALSEQVVGIQQQADTLNQNAVEFEQARQTHESLKQEWTQVRGREEAAIFETKAALAELEERLQQEAMQISARHAELEQQVLSHESENAASLESQAQRDAELDTRDAELSTWESELQQRHDETASRVVLFKKLSAVQRMEMHEGPSVEELQQVVSELEAERSEKSRLSAERDELLTAISELRGAFETAKSELIRLEEEVAQPVGTTELEAAQQTIAERDDELAEIRAALETLKGDAARTHGELEDATARFESDRQLLAEQLEVAQQAAVEPRESAEEERLSKEVEELRAKLAAAETGAEENAAFAARAQTYEDQIQQLTSQLAEAQSQANVPPENEDAQQYLEIIAELKQRLEDQQHGAQPTNIATGDNAVSDEEIAIRQRELDERTVVLDQREEDIRERQRMVENTEGEIEEQRRALLESRQQLELARAEIQVAMDAARNAEADQHASLGIEPQQYTESGSYVESNPEPVQEDSTPQVRSEIAELFGLGDISPPAEEANPVDSELPAVDDYSQEKAAAVSLSFSQADNVLLPAEEELEEQEPATDEADTPAEGDDLVANYMEQLLARNRQNAGGALPDELQKDKKLEPGKEEKKKPPGQASFIEAYMSGEYGDTLDAEAPVTTGLDSTSDSPSATPVSLAAPRPKIDLDALRNDMDSFRQLSTKSVENALATHAKRQQRGGLAARSTICLVLSMICVFVVAAALMNVIPFGTMVVLSIVAAVVSAAELGYQTWALNRRVQKAARTVAPNSKPQAAATPNEIESTRTQLTADRAAAIVAQDEHAAAAAVDVETDKGPSMTVSMEAGIDATSASAEKVGQMNQPENLTREVATEANQLPPVDAVHPADPATDDEPVSLVPRVPESTLPSEPPEVSQSSGNSLGRSQIEELLAEITGSSGEDVEDK